MWGEGDNGGKKLETKPGGHVDSDGGFWNVSMWALRRPMLPLSHSAQITPANQQIAVLTARFVTA